MIVRKRKFSLEIFFRQKNFRQKFAFRPKPPLPQPPSTLIRSRSYIEFTKMVTEVAANVESKNSWSDRDVVSQGIRVSQILFPSQPDFFPVVSQMVSVSVSKITLVDT